MLMIYLNIALQVRNSKDLLIIYIKLKAKEQLRTAVILSDAFAKFQKATTDFVVCLSVRMEQIGSHWTGLQEIWF
jgi:CMP-N-acetylneuraminic acid synthetase